MMFKKTQIRLVVLNALVFFVLINAFGAIMYFSTQHRLYKQVDEMLYTNLQKIREEHHNLRSTSYLIWNQNKQLIQQIPFDVFNENELKKFSSRLEDGFQTLNVGGNTYRVLTQITPVGTIQILHNLESEQKALNNLLFNIVIGSIASVVIALIAGYFLASRALIPIRKAWEKQQQFVSDASHELRTPLSVMQIHLERFFRHPERTIEQESQKVSIMMDENKRMSKLVSDLLTLARSDSNQVELQKKKVNINDVIWKVVQKFEDLAEIKNLSIHVQLQASLDIMGDEERLQQLFIILLDNALKYTNEGTITLNSEKEGNMVKISLHDTGVGISAEDVPYIFDRFFRVDRARGRSEGGTGLGLSIAKWIVEAHEGRIQAVSVLQQGTIIHLYFPIAY